MGINSASSFFLNSADADLGNNATNILYDSTVAPGQTPSATAPGTSHRYRNDRIGERLRAFVACTGQDVQVGHYVELGGVWVLAQALITVTAGATYPEEINVLSWAPGYQVRITNGGTGPTTLNACGWLSKEVGSGS